MQVNIKGTWLTSRAVVDHMRASGGGSIINIASLAAVFGLPYGLDYVASKAAVIGMTRGMARELGRDHIRVNAVAPSAVMTEGTEEFFGEKFEKAKAVIASNQLIPRNLETEDLTGTIVYLASDASRFVTGPNPHGRWRLLVSLAQESYCATDYALRHPHWNRKDRFNHSAKNIAGQSASIRKEWHPVQPSRWRAAEPRLGRVLYPV